MKTALQHLDRGRLQAQLQDSFLQDPAATLCTSHHLTASTGRKIHMLLSWGSLPFLAAQLFQARSHSVQSASQTAKERR